MTRPPLDFTDFFLDEHARCHAAAMSGADQQTIQDRLLDGLTDEAMRPHRRLNSIAWLLWHLSRSEDVMMNVLVTDGPQVLQQGGWRARLGRSDSDMGTGMGDAAVTTLSSQVDIGALLAYRTAVGRRTREVVRVLGRGELDQPIDASRLLLAGAFHHAEDGTSRVRGYRRDRKKRCVVTASHDFLHLGESLCIRSLVISRQG